jgi:hypothetical protein
MLRQPPIFERIPLAVIKKIIEAERMPKRTQSSKQTSRKLILAVPCPTCGVAPGKMCVLWLGDLRTEPHASRKVAASEAVVTKHIT